MPLVNDKESIGPPDDSSHYYFRGSLRIRHPIADPKLFTDILGIYPKRAWKAGEHRQTSLGEPLQGVYPTTYWYAPVLTGRHPELTLDEGIRHTLGQLVVFRDFFHDVRSEGGSTELFIGWFFSRQSGEVLTYETLAKAGDLKIDISFDVYSIVPSVGKADSETTTGR